MADARSGFKFHQRISSKRPAFELSASVSAVAGNPIAPLLTDSLRRIPTFQQIFTKVSALMNGPVFGKKPANYTVDFSPDAGFRKMQFLAGFCENYSCKLGSQGGFLKKVNIRAVSSASKDCDPQRRLLIFDYSLLSPYENNMKNSSPGRKGQNQASAVFTCDREGNISFFNDEAAKLWGYQPEIGSKPEDFLGFSSVKSSAVFAESPLLDALRTGESVHGQQHQVFNRNEEEFTLLYDIDLLRDRDQLISGAIVHFSRTNLPEQELSVKFADSFYRQLIDEIPAAVFSTDNEQNLVYYNKEMARLFAGSAPVLGKPLSRQSLELYNPDGTELTNLSADQSGNGWPAAISLLSVEGDIRNLAIFTSALPGLQGKIGGKTHLLVDITGIQAGGETLIREHALWLEKIVAERTAALMRKNLELKKSEERYHKMVEEVEDYAILLLDPSGNILNWNGGAEKIKGYREKEVIGKHFRIFYREEDIQAGIPEKLISQAREQGKALHEGWRKRKDGSLFWGSIVITALHDEHQNTIGFSKVTRDLTDKKMAEDRILQYTNELEFQNKELEQFSYAASHDLKEPLRKIQFYNKFIADRYADSLDDKGREYLRRSIDASFRMQNLISDILEYSKITERTTALESVDLTEIVLETVSSIKDHPESEHILVDIGQLPAVTGISHQLQQVFANLLGNSVKYRHPQRTPSITIRAGRVKNFEVPTSLLHKTDEYHQIAVSDNGLGFDNKYADRVFEIFQRLNQSNEKGSGVGLAICKKIMQNHNGFITADAQPNIGATFYLYFPVHSI